MQPRVPEPHASTNVATHAMGSRIALARRVVILLLLIVSLLSCTKANPDACCETDEQCRVLGVEASDHRPCLSDKTCSPTTLSCVAAECASSAECAIDTPICSNHVCIASCRSDDDCTTSAGAPLCQAVTGQCVGCLDASTCSSDKPYCDANQHACRGCVADDECASGVCIEADAMCATTDQLLYVSSVGTDAGDCVSSPCATLGFALKKLTETRVVVRVTGATLRDSTAVTFNRFVVIDGDGTTTFSAVNGLVFSFSMPLSGVVTLEGLSFTTRGAFQRAISIGAGDSMRLFDVSFDNSGVHVEGSLDARKVRFQNSSNGPADGGISCVSGSIAVRESTFSMSDITATNCAAAITRNRFLPVTQGITSTGGLLTIDNNLFVVPSEYADLISVSANTPGSTIAFNTIVNTSSVVETPVAIACDGTDRVTSNIIAYHSKNPINGDDCIVHSSLFDLTGMDDAAHNMTADVSTFFRDFAGGDYRLSTNSPALSLGEAGVVSVDVDGNPRPSPAGSLPDVGAFEAR